MRSGLLLYTENPARILLVEFRNVLCPWDQVQLGIGPGMHWVQGEGKGRRGDRETRQGRFLLPWHLSIEVSADESFLFLCVLPNIRQAPGRRTPFVLPCVSAHSSARPQVSQQWRTARRRWAGLGIHCCI